jgi:hypothetical protein
MSSFPWAPRMRGVNPSNEGFTVLVVRPPLLLVVFENGDSVDPAQREIAIDDAAPDLDDEATVGAYVGQIGRAFNQRESGPPWFVFTYYSSTRGRWLIEARKEGAEHRGVAKTLGEGFTRSAALTMAWRRVSA